MMDTPSAPPPAARPMTTDVFHESIADGGLYPRYRLVEWPPLDGEKPHPVATLEILMRVEGAEAFKVEADRCGEAYTLTRPLCEIVRDAGGLPWCIVEVMGPRALICELMVLAQDKGCQRLPFPH
jgi:hypothetical protein